MSDSEIRDRDEQKLAELGYKQELARAWSGFSNFAISFTIISVLAGCFTTYGQAWNNGGPVAISWAWPIIGGLILIIALCMSELVSAYPTAGGPYWWAAKLGGPGWAWFTGWFNVVGLIAVVASVDYAAANFASTLFNLWGLNLGIIDFADAISLDEVFAVFVVLLALHATLNIFSSHLVALFHGISVWWHVLGVAVIIGVLVFVPDHHQSANFVFTDTINNSGFGHGMFWWYVFPLGFLLTMYTVTGYDASAHAAEETRDAEMAAARGIWQSVFYSVIIGWFVLLAITFAATDVAAVNDGGGGAIAIFTSAMSSGWAEFVILISTIGQIFCGMACVTSCSRTFFAFSRDRAVPGHQLWARVSGAGVPAMAVLGSCALAFLIMLPALFAPDTYVPPIAFFAATAIGTVGLYIAYVAPVYLRWRAGDSFETRSWTLGPRYKWINAIAVVFVVCMVIILCLPVFSTGVPWEGDFDWSFFNYTPLILIVVLLGTGLAWVLGMNKRYQGPIRQIEFDEGMGIVEEKPAGPAPATGSTPGPGA